MKGYASNKKKSPIWKISGAVLLAILLAGLATACAGRNGQEGQGEEIEQPLEQKLPDAANAEEANAEAETELEDEQEDTDIKAAESGYLKYRKGECLLL